jgi:hypothetical protein
MGRAQRKIGIGGAMMPPRVMCLSAMLFFMIKFIPFFGLDKPRREVV